MPDDLEMRTVRLFRKDKNFNDMVKRSKDYISNWFTDNFTMKKLFDKKVPISPAGMKPTLGPLNLTKYEKGEILMPRGESSPSGLYEGSSNKIMINPKSNAKQDEIAVHESFHAFDRPELFSMKEGYRVSSHYKDYFLNNLNEDAKWIYNNESMNPDFPRTRFAYLTQPNEIYARIMSIRNELELEPGQDIDLQSLKSLNIKSIEDLRELFTDEKIKEMMEEIASDKILQTNNNIT